ncbi:MAG: hypothetical protein KIS96_14395 [Bauldia sp.]|nr:hypothetical protein [Bauldia sp.]
MNRYLANLYDEQDLIELAERNQQDGLAFSLSATSGRRACEVRAVDMDDACA